ncbi:hypothetical protein HWV62_41330 [Athelia sp. TMB]|nr:hypothetical protein HWV62_18840 [Athelia sp. TMB]KAF7986004.1 hypothetical protein HWV62_41330 [Athelia sp. TMB]
MFAKISTLFVFAAAVLAVNVPRVDDRREVEIPSGENLAALCSSWNSECPAIAYPAATVGGECEPGYEGAGTASVLCYSGTDDFTLQVINALGLTAI